MAILDADKEGFLRSDKSLIQTIGRASRHLSGQVVSPPIAFFSKWPRTGSMMKVETGLVL